jgi:LuxR family transcriptional regulator, maltose regulon positive regulatory protein
MTAMIDDSRSGPWLEHADRSATPALAPFPDGPGDHRVWAMAALLLGAIAREALDKPDVARRLQRPLGAEPALTHGETRVLHYLPTNLSAREIARELCVSVNTIKTHQRHVYQKLGASGRSQAVDRARVLGLLAPSYLKR